MNPKIIGQRLREARKKRGFVLQDLSDLFSVGKLSNIEQGKTSVSTEDIKLICDRIGVPVEEILGEIDIQLTEKIKYKINRIRTLISLNQICLAREILESVKKDTNNLVISFFKPQIDFFEGILHVKEKKYNEAKPLLESSIKQELYTNQNVQYQLRALNALTYIEYIQGNLNNAWDYNLKAREILETGDHNHIQQEADIYFNAAIIAVCIGDITSSKLYLKAASDLASGSFKYDIRLLNAALQGLTGEYQSAFLNLEKCLDYYSKEEDVIGIIKTVQVRYMIQQSDEETYKNEIEMDEKILMSFLDQNKNNMKIDKGILELLYIMAVNKVKHKRYTFAFHLIEIYKELSQKLEKIPGRAPYTAKIYYLEKQLVHLSKPNNELEYNLLKQAHESIRDTESIEKAMILYELVEFEGKKNPNPKLIEAAKIFYRINKMRVQEIFMLQEILPLPRY